MLVVSPRGARPSRGPERWRPVHNHSSRNSEVNGQREWTRERRLEGSPWVWGETFSCWCRTERTRETSEEQECFSDSWNIHVFVLQVSGETEDTPGRRGNATERSQTNPSWHGHGDSWQVCDHQRHLWGAAGGDNQESTWSAGYYGYLNSLCVAAHWRRNVLFKRGVDFGTYFWELFVWICCFLAPLTYERIQPHNLVCLLIYRWIVFKRLSN